MNYTILDGNGQQVGDLASEAGMKRLRANPATPASLLRFIERRYAGRGLLRKIVDDCSAAKGLKRLADMLRGVPPPVRLADADPADLCDPQEDVRPRYSPEFLKRALEIGMRCRKTAEEIDPDYEEVSEEPGDGDDEEFAEEKAPEDYTEDELDRMQERCKYHGAQCLRLMNLHRRILQSRVGRGQEDGEDSAK